MSRFSGQTEWWWGDRQSIGNRYVGLSKRQTATSDQITAAQTITKSPHIDCGWTAVRFSERQVREQPEACIDLLRQVVSRLRGTSDELHCQVTPEQRWTQQEAVKMEKDLVREKRLHIQSFGMPDYRKDEVEEMLAAQVAVSI